MTLGYRDANACAVSASLKTLCPTKVAYVAVGTHDVRPSRTTISATMKLHMLKPAHFEMYLRVVSHASRITKGHAA